MFSLCLTSCFSSTAIIRHKTQRLESFLESWWFSLFSVWLMKLGFEIHEEWQQPEVWPLVDSRSSWLTVKIKYHTGGFCPVRTVPHSSEAWGFLISRPGIKRSPDFCSPSFGSFFLWLCPSSGQRPLWTVPYIHYLRKIPIISLFLKLE